MNFTALDFETANYYRNSACSIGLAKVRKGAIVEAMYSLIKPPTDYFLPRFVELHGIDWSMVENAPTFRELWPRIAAFIGKDKLAAHNYGFDKGVLEATLEYYGIEAPDNRWICSFQMARRTWPKLEAFRLDEVAASLNISLDHHHALDDARACALICIAADRHSKMGKTKINRD